jgi:hypothetical protein
MQSLGLRDPARQAGHETRTIANGNTAGCSNIVNAVMFRAGAIVDYGLNRQAVSCVNVTGTETVYLYGNVATDESYLLDSPEDNIIAWAKEARRVAGTILTEFDSCEAATGRQSCHRVRGQEPRGCANKSVEGDGAVIPAYRDIKSLQAAPPLTESCAANVAARFQRAEHGHVENVPPQSLAAQSSITEAFA